MAETPDDLQPSDELAGMVVCDVTGQLVPEAETVVLHGRRVGAEGKAILLDQLAAGLRFGAEIENGGIWRRIFATVIDYVVMGLFNFSVMLIFNFGTIAAMLQGQPVPTTPVLLQALMAVALALFRVVYDAGMHGRWGMTLGKMATRTRVVNLDGSPVSYTQAGFRTLWKLGPGLAVSFIPLLGQNNLTPAVSIVMGSAIFIYFLVNVVLVLLHPRQCAVHDLLTGTRVIRAGE